MFNTAFNKSGGQSLINEYTSLLGEAALRHRTRRAEQEARIEAELANRVKSEFISNMSHELRTPLNTVLGFSRILAEHGERKIPDEQIVDYATLIRDAAGHLLSVINDILDISKIQSGKYSLDTQEVNVEEVLRGVISKQRVEAQANKIKITENWDQNLPSVKGDARKLGQVFSNLIANAIQFSQTGAAVEITARTDQQRGVTIMIRDHGCGMTEEETRVALTPFGQVDGSRTRSHEGTGLGLPIAKTLTELHGGQLKIESVKGEGTTVIVALPPAHQVSVARAREIVVGRGTTL